MDFFGASAVIIGNEVLSAKVEEKNGAWLISRLHQVGIPLRFLAVVPDEVEQIVHAVNYARTLSPNVFTSGGIGPTHDDLTVKSIARALKLPVIQHPELVDLVSRHYGPNPQPEAYRLAAVPQGSELLWHQNLRFPVVSCQGVYLLPGVPELFKLQLEAVLSRMKGEPLFLIAVYFSVGEVEIVSALDRITSEMPDVQVGSYPEFNLDSAYQVKVTAEHREPSRVRLLVDRLLEMVPAQSVLRIDESRIAKSPKQPGAAFPVV